jgi:putative peptidoglycan lipid II flippase
MAVVTMLSRLTGWVRDKALFWVLGASDLNDAFRVAFRIPNAFRALLAEGALHAAFVPALSRLAGREDARAEAQELIRGLLGVLLMILAAVVGLGMLFAPLLVRAFAEGYTEIPGKLEMTVLMTRVMFPYLGFISVAALLQGILNSNEKFLLPAATPILFNLTLAGIAVFFAEGSENVALWLGAAVLVGGAFQAALQWPAVRSLGIRLNPLWTGFRDPAVRRVLVLMLPGIPVLGISQLNQLISTRFGSYLGEGGVSILSGAYRVTELMFGGIVVQMTTVLLPVLSRQLRQEPEEAPKTLLDTIALISFVTLPTATFLAVMAVPVIGLAFGGGRFGPEAVAVTGATLAAYAFSLVGLGQAKVMASAFFAQRNTKTPMWCSLASLVIFTAGCFALVGPLGAPGIGLANTIAVCSYAVILSVVYGMVYGFGRVSFGPLMFSVVRQLVGCGALLVVAWKLAPWLADVHTTSLISLAKVGGAAVLSGGTFIAVVSVLGGREMISMLRGFRGRS